MSDQTKKNFEQMHDVYSVHDSTIVFREDEFENNAPHHYLITEKNVKEGETQPNILTELLFQNGVLSEGVNGIMDENLIAIVIDRLTHFQESQYSSKENAMAITKLQEAQHWLMARTASRKLRNVHGTHEV